MIMAAILAQYNPGGVSAQDSWPTIPKSQDRDQDRDRVRPGSGPGSGLASGRGLGDYGRDDGDRREDGGEDGGEDGNVRTVSNKRTRLPNVRAQFESFESKLTCEVRTCELTCERAN